MFFLLFFFWGDGEMKYVFDSFRPLASFQNKHLQNIFGYVL